MSKKRKALLFLFSGIFIYYIFHQLHLIAKINQLLFSALQTPLKIAAVISNQFHSANLDVVMERTFQLKKEVQYLRKELADLEETRAENSRLKALLKLSEGKGRKRVYASVVTGSTKGSVRTIILNKGKRDGIEKNMAVLSHGGLVGRVIEVYPRLSKVILITDFDSKVGSMIQRTRDRGVVVGMSDLSLKMIYLPLDSKIQIGDIVLTSGMGGIYPKGLLVGSVTDFKDDLIKMYKYVIIDPSSDLVRLEEVVCIK